MEFIRNNPKDLLVNTSSDTRYLDNTYCLNDTCYLDDKYHSNDRYYSKKMLFMKDITRTI